jgi:hypothetical protein
MAEDAMTDDDRGEDRHEDDLREEAITRLKNRRGFWPHLICYIAVNTLLVGVWAASGGGYFWPIWVIGGWGIGIVMHAWTAFFEKPISEEEVEREMRRGGTAV